MDRDCASSQGPRFIRKKSVPSGRHASDRSYDHIAGNSLTLKNALKDRCDDIAVIKDISKP